MLSAKPSGNLGAITLNEHLGVTTADLDKSGVLNTILGSDTKLFVDPKLIRKTDIPEFVGSIEDVETYFSELLAFNAQAKFPMARSRAISMIAIKEPKGLSIGYGNSRDSGTSISRTVAINALRALSELVRIGLEDEKVMEMLGLYIKRFASDSISDLIVHITYPRFCSYTERKSKELGIETSEYTIRGKTYQLPQQPGSNKRIILLPLDLLNDLPIATSWDEIAAAARVNAEVKNDFNRLVGSSLTKFEKRVKSNPDLLIQSKDSMELLMKVYDKALVDSYDTTVDRKGYVRLTQYAAQLNTNKPAQYIRLMNSTEMMNFVEKEIIGALREDIEIVGVNELLYKQTSKGKVLFEEPLHEHAIQTLLHAIARRAGNASNIIAVREPKMGKSAVDFYIGTNPSNKILIEIKKSDNSSLLDGYSKQLERYIKNENAPGAFYLVVLIDRDDFEKKNSQFNQLREKYAEQIRNKDKCPELIIINALEKTPPSKEK